MNVSTPVVVLAPGYHGHEVARSLGRLGVPTYGVHSDLYSPTARSRYWRANLFWDLIKQKPEDSIEQLLQFGRQTGSRPILIPTDDDSCLFVEDYAAELKDGFLFPERPPGLVRALTCKKDMYFLCKKFGLPVAETLFPTGREDVIEFARHIEFPVLLKGIDTLELRKRAGVKMVLVENESRLLELYDRLETPESPNLMVQEYLPGGSKASWMFDAYFDADSNCRFGLTAHMIRQYPPYAGRTSLGVCRANDVISQQTRDFMKAIGYRGALDIGFKLDHRTGQYKAFDANPRVGATFRLMIDTQGLDVVRAMYLDLTGQPVPYGKPREGRKWVVENFDLLSSSTYRHDEKMSALDWLRTYRGVEEASWFALDDPMPFTAMILRSLLWGRDRMFGRSAQKPERQLSLA